MTEVTIDQPALIPVSSNVGWFLTFFSDGARTAPITVTLASDKKPRAVYYNVVTQAASGWRAAAAVELGAAVIEIRDEITTDGGDVCIARHVQVHGDLDDAFTSGLWVGADDIAAQWADAEVFAPGVAYGDAGPVPAGTLGGQPARAADVQTVLIREDRLAAPVISVRASDGRWLAVLHEAPDAATVAADGVVEQGGEDLVDARMRFAALGGLTAEAGLVVGACFPGTEGEYTYSTGGLPLTQPHRWRHRFHPITDGLIQEYSIRFRRGTSATATDWFSSVWRWAWSVFTPVAATADLDAIARSATAVLADQIVRSPAGVGVPLEADAVSTMRTVEASEAVMGFVGANTDVGHLLLQEAERAGVDTARYRQLGIEILDSFTKIPLDPPAAEGFDAFTGTPTTYRTHDGRLAVYARALAEGALAVLHACQHEQRLGEAHPQWLRWAVAAGEWLVAAQADTGAMPRAWEAGTGAVLDASTTASYAAVPFLTALAAASSDAKYLDAAVAGADFSWQTSGKHGCFAGATLDNPDVVDKEAAILSTEGFLDLYDATVERQWLERAVAAASIAETWIYIWDVPMPVDANDDTLHWKRDVSTIGHQLIASGVSMTDGFLAVNASAFARLYQHTGDQHWLAVAQLVTHGTTTMFALPGRTFDLRGVGWQQEHWCFAGRRGYGLNRRWLPWVAVAHVRGLHRLLELGPDIADLVLRGYSAPTS